MATRKISLNDLHVNPFVELNEAQKLKVLYLTKVYPFPPENAGDAVYSRGIIQALSTKCDLTVLCTSSKKGGGGGGKISWRYVGPERAGIAKSVFSTLPLIAWRYKTKNYCAELEEQLHLNWDSIIIDNIGMVGFLDQVLSYKNINPETKIVYVSHENEFKTRSEKYKSYKMSLPKRLLSYWDLSKVVSWEKKLLEKSDIVTMITMSDLRDFKEISSEEKYFHLSPGYSGEIIEESEVSMETPKRILLLGGRRSEQKKQILLEWLSVSSQAFEKLGIETVVVGEMDSDLRDCIRQRYPRVVVKGFVDDLESLIRGARLGVIADTVGGGFKLRLLTHVFYRLPIVGLEGSIDGLPTSDGRGFITASTLPKLVELVANVVDDFGTLNSLQNEAYISCKDVFSWDLRAQYFVEALTCGKHLH